MVGNTHDVVGDLAIGDDLTIGDEALLVELPVVETKGEVDADPANERDLATTSNRLFNSTILLSFAALAPFETPPKPPPNIEQLLPLSTFEKSSLNLTL